MATAAPGDTVSIPAGTYMLTHGAIAIGKHLTLAGAGARSTILDGNAASRVLELGVSGQDNQNEVFLFDLTVRNGQDPGEGGGILNQIGLIIQRCLITANRSGTNGGGIYNNGGNLLVQESLVAGNQAGAAGGKGGGIYSNGNILMTNSTVSGNTAGNSGGGLAINDTLEFLAISNSTIAGNSAPSGGGMVTNETVLLNNTIIAGNSGGDCTVITDDPLGSDHGLDSDHSLDSDGSCGLMGPGDLPGAAPLLGPLADNGGPTDTRALLTGSPAIDAGADCQPTDQRGVSRPQGPACDIGAYEKEVNSNAPPVLAADQASVTFNEGDLATNTGTVTDANHDTVTLTASVGSVIILNDGTWFWSFQTSDGPTQSQTVTITGDDGHGGTASTSFSLVVNNVAPQIFHVGNNGPVSAGSPATISVVAFDVAGANDPLSYSFDCDNNGTFEIGPQAGSSAACTFATAGSKTVNVRVTDGDGGTATSSTVVTVLSQPPNCSSATASPNLLWPPNHKFVPITISGIVNPAGGAVTITVTSIFQDEPVQSPGSGNTSPDATGVGTGSPSVRAERDGNGDGRVYHINFTATGASGSCTGSVTVGVPHDQGHGSLIDGGSLYNSTTP